MRLNNLSFIWVQSRSSQAPIDPRDDDESPPDHRPSPKDSKDFMTAEAPLRGAPSTTTRLFTAPVFLSRRLRFLFFTWTVMRALSGVAGRKTPQFAKRVNAFLGPWPQRRTLQRPSVRWSLRQSRARLQPLRNRSGIGLEMKQRHAHRRGAPAEAPS